MRESSSGRISSHLAATRQLRLLGLLDGAERIGLAPVGLQTLHSLAYFSDVLAPIWNLPVIDGQLLKQVRLYYPSLQEDIDSLVATGVVTVSNVDYVEWHGAWTLSAEYMPNHFFSDRILAAAGSYENRTAEMEFVREVVYATSGLGSDGMPGAPNLDATYSDPIVAVGGIVDLVPDGELNRTAEIALRFSKLARDSDELSVAEIVNLYVRLLYSRLRLG